MQMSDPKTVTNSKKGCESKTSGEQPSVSDGENPSKRIEWPSFLNLLQSDQIQIIADWNLANTNENARECSSDRHIFNTTCLPSTRESLPILRGLDGSQNAHTGARPLGNYQHSSCSSVDQRISRSVDHRPSSAPRHSSTSTLDCQQLASILVNNQQSATTSVDCQTSTPTTVDHQQSTFTSDHCSTTTSSSRSHQQMLSVSVSHHPMSANHQNSIPTVDCINQHSLSTSSQHHSKFTSSNVNTASLADDQQHTSSSSIFCSGSANHPHSNTTHIDKVSDAVFPNSNVQCVTSQKPALYSTAVTKELLQNKTDTINIEPNRISPPTATKRQWQVAAGSDSCPPDFDNVKNPCLNSYYATPILQNIILNASKSLGKPIVKPVIPFYFGAPRGSVNLPEKNKCDPDAPSPVSHSNVQNTLYSLKSTTDGQFSIQYHVNDPYTQKCNYRPIASKVNDIQQMINLLNQSQNETKGKQSKQVSDDADGIDCVPITIRKRSYMCTKKALSSRTVKDLIDTASLLPGGESDSELDEVMHGASSGLAVLPDNQSTVGDDKIQITANSNGPHLPVKTSPEAVGKENLPTELLTKLSNTAACDTGPQISTPIGGKSRKQLMDTNNNTIYILDNNKEVSMQAAVTSKVGAASATGTQLRYCVWTPLKQKEPQTNSTTNDGDEKVDSCTEPMQLFDVIVDGVKERKSCDSSQTVFNITESILHKSVSLNKSKDIHQTVTKNIQSVASQTSESKDIHQIVMKNVQSVANQINESKDIHQTVMKNIQSEANQINESKYIHQTVMKNVQSVASQTNESKDIHQTVMKNIQSEASQTTESKDIHQTVIKNVQSEASQTTESKDIHQIVMKNVQSEASQTTESKDIHQPVMKNIQSVASQTNESKDIYQTVMKNVQSEASQTTESKDIHQTVMKNIQSEANQTIHEKTKNVSDVSADIVPVTFRNRSYTCTKKALNMSVRDLIVSANLLSGSKTFKSKLDETPKGNAATLLSRLSTCCDDKVQATSNSSVSLNILAENIKRNLVRQPQLGNTSVYVSPQSLTSTEPCSGLHTKQQLMDTTNNTVYVTDHEDLSVQTAVNNTVGSARPTDKTLTVDCVRTQLMHTYSVEQPQTESATCDGDERLVFATAEGATQAHTVNSTTQIHSVDTTVEKVKESNIVADISQSLQYQNNNLNESIDTHKIVNLQSQSKSSQTPLEQSMFVSDDSDDDCVPITFRNKTYICPKKALSIMSVRDLIITANLLSGEKSDFNLDEKSKEVDDPATLHRINSACGGEAVHIASNSSSSHLALNSSTEKTSKQDLPLVQQAHQDSASTHCIRSQLSTSVEPSNSVQDRQQLMDTNNNTVNITDKSKELSVQGTIKSYLATTTATPLNDCVRTHLIQTDQPQPENTTGDSKEKCVFVTASSTAHEVTNSVQKTNILLHKQDESKDADTSNNHLWYKTQTCNIVRRSGPIRSSSIFEVKDSGKNVTSTRILGKKTKTKSSLPYGFLKGATAVIIHHHGRTNGSNVTSVSQKVAYLPSLPLDLRVNPMATIHTAGKMSVPNHQTYLNMNSKVSVPSSIHKTQCSSNISVLHHGVVPLGISTSCTPAMSNVHQNNQAVMCSFASSQETMVVPPVSGLAGQPNTQTLRNQSNTRKDQSVQTGDKETSAHPSHGKCGQQTQNMFVSPSLENRGWTPSQSVQQNVLPDQVTSVNPSAPLFALSYTSTANASSEEPEVPESLLYQCSEEDAKLVERIRSGEHCPEEKPKPKHFLISELSIGNYKYSHVGANSDRTSKIKILFTRRRMVYELLLDETEHSVVPCIKQQAVVEIGFDTIVHLWGHSKHLVFELSESPSMYLGTRVCNTHRPEMHYNHMPCYNRSKPADITGGYLDISPYHFITLRRPNADKVKQCFAEISDRFCEMLLHPLIVYTQKELLNHNHKDLVTVQLKSVNPAKTQTTRCNNKKLTSSEHGCACTGGCRSRNCQCRNKGTVCSDCCVCYKCDNPLNIMKKMGVLVDMVCLDTCLMQNIYQVADLRTVLMKELILQCCQIPVRLKDCIPGPIPCPNKPLCRASYRFSWCKAELCNEDTNKRNHCPLCQTCVQPRNQHCQRCNRCFYQNSEFSVCSWCSFPSYRPMCNQQQEKQSGP